MSNLQENNSLSYLKKDNDNVKNCIGYFLLELYHKAYFGYNGYISKQKVRYEFQEYLKRNNLLESPILLQSRIGALLQEAGFLRCTKKGSGQFQIQMINFREFYNNIIKQLDEVQIKASTSQILPNLLTETAETKENVEISLNGDKYTLEFQRGTQVLVKNDFCLTNMGCFICQQNFSTEEDFDNHIEYHGEASGFQSISNYSQLSNPDFELSYQTCKNNYLLCFTLKTNRTNFIIEKIIIVRSRGMIYARNEDVPFDVSPNGVEHFFVDSHLFNVGILQPIVIVYQRKDQNSIRHIAQYLFVRYDEFPVVNMKLKSTRVLSRDEMKKVKKIPPYFPLIELKECLRQNDDLMDNEICQLFPTMRPYLEDKEIRSSNIYEIYKILLQIEDIEISNKYEKLSRKGCEIKGYCGEYSVMMTNLPPGINLTETLNPFDEIVLRPQRNANNNNNDENNKGKRRGKNKGIRGYVYRVYGKKVCFKPRNYVGQIPLNRKYDVSFNAARTPIIYQYHALELLMKKVNLRNFLFPTINFNKTPSELRLEFYNEHVKINPEQMQAVMNIADGPNGAAPYIIFGPPGTGKTTTVVESIYQLWKKNKENKILVTAGSNAACDEVARRLCEIFTKIDPEGLNLLRIYAASVEKRIDNIDEDLLEASNLCHNYHFYPSIGSVTSYRVVIATLTVVGKLLQANLNEKCFSHIFIDECAASTETEALVGIVGVLSPNAKLILSGDPKQLGPILKSQKAADLGLNQSLMERLLQRKCYEVDQKTGEYDRSLQTRLIRNFRAHPDILKLSNLLYYHGELKSCAKNEITNWALGWHRLPRKDFPIIFNVVYGHTDRDKQSPSLCNFKELSVVLDYIKNLMFFGINGRKITENDIGVISPYKKQCNLIREELDKRGWYKIETGSVETFQGKEKPIIVISMVRSNMSGIGFLDNPKRLNVTLTRAQSLMIIIGNPETLEKFDDWKEVIEYCKENRALTGAKYPREQFQPIDLQTSQSSLSTISNLQQKTSRYRTPIEAKLSKDLLSFKTSQSSLSTISNVQQHQKSKQKSGVEEKNNQRHGQRRNVNRPLRNVRKNKPHESEVSDCISLSSHLEEKVDDWLEKTAKFYERFSKDEVSSSTKSLVCGDFEIINQSKLTENDLFNIIQSERTVYREKCRYPLDTETKDFVQKISENAASNVVVPSTSYQSERNRLAFPQNKIVNTNREESNKTLTNRVTLPQQPIKSSTMVRPMLFSENSSTNQRMSSLSVSQTTTTVNSSQPLQLSSNGQPVQMQDSRFQTNRNMPTVSSNIVKQSYNYSFTPNYDDHRINLNQQGEKFISKKSTKKSCTIS